MIEITQEQKNRVGTLLDSFGEVVAQAEYNASVLITNGYIGDVTIITRTHPFRSQKGKAKFAEVRILIEL